MIRKHLSSPFIYFLPLCLILGALFGWSPARAALANKLVTTFNLRTTALLTSPSSGACLTETTQADFQTGTSSNVDLTTSPGDVTLTNALTVDQSNTAGTTTGTGFGAVNWTGQTFIAAITGTLVKADIQLFCSGCGATPPNLTLSVRNTSAGLPTGADLATVTIPGSTFSSGGTTLYTASFGSPTTLTAGTQYALILRPVSAPAGSGYFWIRSSPSTYANGSRVLTADSGSTWSADTTRDYNFKTYIQTGYAASGSQVSATKDTNPAAGFAPTWTSLSWTATTPANTSLKFQVAASNSASGPFNFVGPDSTASTFFTTSGASLSQFNGLRYLQYKAYLSTTDNATTPTLNDVTICYDTINTTPAITASSALNRQQGAGASSATIATVSDSETAAGSLTVTATTVPTGITVNNIVNSNGTITADVAADCTAATGNNTVVLTVTDGGGLTATANLTVNVTPGAATLGNYSNSSLAAGGNTTVTPSAAPSGASFVSVATSTSFKGTLTVNPATGAVSITDAGPAGSYTITVKASSNCNTTSQTFTLTVGDPVACNSGGFADKTDFTAHTAPDSIAIGDFNGDGKQDLAVANNDSHDVSILLGDGNGSFSAATNFSVGTAPSSVTIGDFNGDGKQDLAVSNFSSDNVSILLGDGNGGFSAATNFSVGTAPRAVTVGDFNGDGKQDLAVSNFGSSNVSILLGDGTGNFGAATNFNAQQAAAFTAIGDFNGDGKQDLAIADVGPGNVRIMLGDGNGGFGTATDFAVGTRPQFVVIGDFNGDGKQDLAVANQNSNNVSVLLGDGNGGFGAATNFSVGTDPQTLAIGDFNGDGKQDLVTTNFTSNDISILLGDGNGSFGAATNLSLGHTPKAVAVGDFNGDGKLDLVTANIDGDNASVLLSNCTSAPLISDLTISQSDGGASVAPGGTVSYTLTYSNTGDHSATGVVLTETVPANTTFNAGASTAGWSCTPNNNAGSTCTLAIGNLAVGSGNQTATFAVTVVNPVAAGVTQISNTASIADDGTNGTDPTPGNNSGSDTTPITGAPDLSIATSDGGASVTPGGTVAYTLTFANSGNRGASSVILTETIPANTTFNAGASTAGWVCTPNNNAGSTCTLAVGGLAAGSGNQTATFAITVVNPIPAGFTQISNTASIADDGANGTDPTPGNNSGSDTTPVMKTTQAITFNSLADKTYGQAAFSVSATASSNLPVTFSILSGPATINNSTVTITGAGTVVVRASQAGDDTYSAATDVDQSFQVNKAALTVTANNQSRGYGAANPAFTASYSGFVNNDTASVLSGQPSLTTTANPGSDIGNYPITASTGTLSAANYDFTFVDGTLTVNKAATSAALASSLAPASFGQSITLTATVSSGNHTLTGARQLSNVSISSPTGNVQFFDGANLLGTAALSSGSASFSTASLSASDHTLTAIYLGDDNFEGSTSTTITQTVNQAVSQVTLTSSANPAVRKQYLTFTATVSGVNNSVSAAHTVSVKGGATINGSSALTGTVTFKDGEAVLGTATINSVGRAAFSTSALTTGSHSITAEYSGSANYQAAAASALDLIVSKGLSVTSIASSANPSSLGQPVTLSATVLGAGGLPTGSVEFFAGGVSLGTAQLNGLNASLTISTLSDNLNSLTAVYKGDDQFDASASSALTQTVVPYCTYTLSALTQTFDLSGGGGQIKITTRGGCGWTATSDANWITVLTTGINNGDGIVYFTVAPLTNNLARTGTITIAGQTVTITQAKPIAVVSAASYVGLEAAPGAIVSLFGVNLSAGSDTVSTLPLPTTLAGTSVKVTDSQGVARFAPLFYVSPSQINYLIPSDTALGAATITVINDTEEVTGAGVIQIVLVSPGLFTANSNGQDVAAAVLFRLAGDGTQSYEAISQFDPQQNKYVPTPIDLGPDTDQVFLLLFGTGLRNRTSLEGVTAFIGNVEVEVLYAGPQGGFEGLDQVNLSIPRSAIGAGETNLVLTVDGKVVNTVRINIR